MYYYYLHDEPIVSSPVFLQCIFFPISGSSLEWYIAFGCMFL